MPRRAAASPRRQKGAVAILVGLSLFVLVMMLGLVMDLGQLYITRTELQNAADAGALAGAREMNGTAAGITSAEARAISTAAANSVRFGANAGAVTIGRANVEYGTTPDGPWNNYATATAAPGGLSFIKVDTHGISQGTLATWFMRVSNIDVMNTFGRAVAGTFSTGVTPLGVCAIDPSNSIATGELLEYGFRRGMNYDVIQINNAKKGLAGLAQVPLWINPVDSVGSGCNPSHSSASFAVPFVCVGRASSVNASTNQVFINTGSSASLDRPLNSRFNVYQGNSCDPTTAPPDMNIKPYSVQNPTNANNTNPDFWMSPDYGSARRQAVDIFPDGNPNAGKPVNWPNLLTTPPDQIGVLWSYSRAMRTNGTTFDTTNWPTLYNPGISTDAAYPATPGTGFPAGTPPAPYNQYNRITGVPVSSNYAEQPVGRPGLPERRVLQLVIVNCDAPAGAVGSCQTMDVLSVGKFFMPVRANLPSSLAVEFAGLTPWSQLEREIRLFR